MTRKRDKFWGGFEKQSALKLRWRRAADCSRGGFRQLETHVRQQWRAVYVGSLAARMTTTGDVGGWNRRRSGCCRKDIVEPDRAQLTWNRCVPETAANVRLAAALVLRAHTEKSVDDVFIICLGNGRETGQPGSTELDGLGQYTTSWQCDRKWSASDSNKP